MGKHASSEDPSDNDRSGLSARAHRQLIGYMGLALPILLLLITWLRRDDPRVRWAARRSASGQISSYE